MKEIIVLALMYIIFLTASFFFYKKMISVDLKWVFVFTPVYLIGLYFYFDVLGYANDFLRDRNIYFEFGHADIALVMLGLFCFCNAMLLILLIAVVRVRKKHR